MHAYTSLGAYGQGAGNKAEPPRRKSSLISNNHGQRTAQLSFF
jgi:hypothetical protein